MIGDPSRDGLLSALILSNWFWTIIQGAHDIFSLLAVASGAVLGIHAIWTLWKNRHGSGHNAETKQTTRRQP